MERDFSDLTCPKFVRLLPVGLRRNSCEARNPYILCTHDDVKILQWNNEQLSELDETCGEQKACGFNINKAILITLISRG
jgi:hypothetical protein